MATVNNNWPTPVQTDLVKDGWEAIKDLGDAIDTTLGVYSPTSSGLVLLNTTSFSGVSSQSINDVFSTTYDNYRIILRTDSTPSTSTIRLRLRVSGADNTTSNYGSVNFLVNNGTTRTQESLATSLKILESTDTGNDKSFCIDILQPFAAIRTQYQGTFAGIGGDVTGDQVGLTGGGFDVTTSFTGFTVFPNAGVFSGALSVFGYNK
jgi:hypothetical protein